MRRAAALAIPILLSLLGSAAAAKTLEVGPGKTYPAPCAAIAAAAPGDVIEIDAAGVYQGDVCSWSTDHLTIRGVNGRPVIDAAGESAGGKAIWVIAGDDTTIEDVELTGATVPDQNGAGIRQEGKNLTVRRCYFHDNEDGILAGDSPGSEILVEGSEFAHNGFGDGFSHNMYINHVARFTLQYSYSHHSKVGHLVKSRAAETYILYNRLSDEADGTGSYEIDLPNGGASYVVGNLVEQGPATQNSAMLEYLFEGPHADNPSSALYVVNNTFVNDRPGDATFVAVGDSDATPAVLRNNVFAGPGVPCNQAAAVLEGNYVGGDPLFVDQAGYDYHLQRGSPCVGAGVPPGVAGAFDLTPAFQYVHPANAEDRSTVGTIDIGAYELGGGSGSGGGGGSLAAGGGGAAASGGAGGAAAGPAGAGGAAQAASSGGATADDGGCGCRTEPAGSLARRGAWLAVAAGALLAAARRRSRET